MEYELVVYVRPVCLNWALKKIKTITELYNANLWEIKIKRANSATPFKGEVHEVGVVVWANDKRSAVHIERKIEREIGMLKWH